MGGKVWVLNLQTYEWREEACKGEVPHPRLYHSAVSYGDTMLMYGGEIAETTGSDPCSYYELDLQSFTWRAVPTHGGSPGHRSHHTAAVVDGVMYIMGGRETAHGRPCHQTVRSLREATQQGFFNIFALDIKARTWRTIERVDPLHPMTWGHSACVFRHFILLFGGFDVSLQEDESPHDAPSATLSSSVYSYDTSSFTWRVLSSKTGVRQPCVRALHVSLTCMSEMFVVGGMSVDAGTGESRVLNDAWTWDIASGLWSCLEDFCIPSFEAKRLLSVVHGSKLYVCGGVGSVHVLDLTKKSAGWTEYSCDARALAKKQNPVAVLAPQQRVAEASPAYNGEVAVPADLPMRVASVDREPSLAAPQMVQPAMMQAMQTAIQAPHKDSAQIANLHHQLQSLQLQLSQVAGEQQLQPQQQQHIPQMQPIHPGGVPPEHFPYQENPALGPPADPTAEVVQLQQELRRLQEQQKQQQESLHRRHDVMDEIQRRRAVSEMARLEEQRIPHSHQPPQPPPPPQPQTYYHEPPQPQPQPEQQHYAPHYEAPRNPTMPSGEAKLLRYRRSKERRGGSGSEASEPPETRQVEHENRRLQHLKKLQEQLREIETGVGEDQAREEAVLLQQARAASVSPAFLPPAGGGAGAVLPNVQSAQSDLLRQQFEAQRAQLQMQMHQYEQQMEQLQQAKLQQQQHNMLQQSGGGGLRQASPRHSTSPQIMHNRNISPVPTDPADWNMLKV